MFKFKKKSDSGATPDRRADLLIESQDGVPEIGRASLAFGLTWRSIVSQSADPLKVAYKSVRTSGGTDVTLRGKTQYGFGRISPQTRAEAAPSIWSAAAVVARQNAGSSIYAIRLGEYPDGSADFWLAVTRSGHPTSVDRIFHAEDSLEIVAEVNKLLEESNAEGNVLDLYTNIDGALTGNTAKDPKTYELEDIFLCRLLPEDRLLQVPKAGATLPKPVLYVLVAGMAVVVAQQGWKRYQAYEKARLAKLNMVVDEPPAQAWARVISKWTAEHVAGSSQGLTLARLSLGTVPPLWGGWTLVSASCSAVAAPKAPAAGAAPAPTAAPTGHRTWSCTAHYTRPPIGRDNREVLEHVPAGWQVKFSGLSTLDASWSFEEPTQPLVIADLKSTQFHTVDTASKLQSLVPAYSGAVGFTFVPVPLTPPKRKDGKAVPMDVSTPQLKQVPIDIHGPLRTIDALAALPMAVDWTRLSIGFDITNVSSPSLKSSSLNAFAQGVIYAKD